MVAVVGLLVLGPERLPVALRTTSLWLGASAPVQRIRAEVEREIGADEIRAQPHGERIMDQEP